MNFNLLNRGSAVGPIYTDRPSGYSNATPQPWKKIAQESLHLNPSKSKLSVRNSLNKTGDNSCLSQPNFDTIRASTLLSNPPKPAQHMSKDSILDEKYQKLGKENNQTSINYGLKENCTKFTPNFFSEEVRKKSDSMKVTAFQTSEKRALQELRGQLSLLAKKVDVNEQQIHKIKEKRQKDRKLQALQHEFTQFQIQMFDICKKNTNYFSEFEDRIQKNYRSITDLRDQLQYKDSAKEEIQKKISKCECRLSQLSETLLMKEEHIIKNIAVQLSAEESMIKTYINDQINDVKLKLDKSGIESGELLSKIAQLEKQFVISKWEDNCFIKDNKRSLDAVMIERKESIIFRQHDGNREQERASRSSITTKESNILQKVHSYEEKVHSSEESRELVVNHRIYYIDRQGYLLDDQRYYLINTKNEKIMLPDHLLRHLKDHNMLYNLVPPRM